MKMIAGIDWTLNKLKDHYGKKLGQKIHDSENIKVECFNSKCKQFYKEQEIPDGGGGLIGCPDCGTYFKVPKGPDYSGTQHPNAPLNKQEGETRSKDEDPSEKSVGTGFFVDNKGHIITNYHVVKFSNNKSKILFKHDEISTNLIAHDEVLDLALLKAKVSNKHFIKFSNKSPKKAQSILVAGFPYGKFVSDDLKITAGIINSLKGIANNTSMLQIDATVNPGNSGGPIVDKASGNLVGVATMKLSKDFTKAVFGQESENTNYGIKASQVKDFLEANNINISVKPSKLKISELEESTVYVFCKAMETVKYAEANKQEDKKKREAADARNHAETIIHVTKKTLKDFAINIHGNKISDPDRLAIEDGISDLQSALYYFNKKEVMKKIQNLMGTRIKSFSPEILKIYKRITSGKI